MKIFFSITKSEIGGAQICVLELAKHFHGKGNEIAIMTHPGGFLEDEAKALGIKFYPNVYFANSFNPINLVRAFSGIKKAVTDFKPDLIHAHSSSAGFLTRLAIRNKIPTIFTAHGFAFSAGASLFRKIVAVIAEFVASRFCSKIICVSDYDRRLAIRYKIASPGKVVTVHNGIRALQPIPVDMRRNVFLSVGRLVRQKEFEILIKAFAEAKIPHTKLEIIGDGPDRNFLLKKIRSLNAQDLISIVGEMSYEEVRIKMQESKVFFLISRHEGLPLTIIEAMSAGLPVVASNVGGVPEEIGGGCGILVENDVRMVTNAIRRISDERLQIIMGEAARKKFLKDFTLDKFLSETEKVYEEVMNSL